LHHVSLPISPNPGTEGRFATSARTSINAQLIAWFQHVRAKEIGIVTRDFVCEMIQFFCNVP
jgi:hypothetical protein